MHRKQREDDDEGEGLLPAGYSPNAAFKHASKVVGRHYRISVVIGICLGFLITGVINLYIFLGARACPAVPLLEVQFTKNMAFQNLSQVHDDDWQNLIAPNGGFFFEYSNTGNLEAYGISMFHQLHCLSNIRRALQQQYEPMNSVAAENTNHGEHSAVHSDMNHILHCMDYIRQVEVPYSCFPDRGRETHAERDHRQSSAKLMTLLSRLLHTRTARDR